MERRSTGFKCVCVGVSTSEVLIIFDFGEVLSGAESTDSTAFPEAEESDDRRTCLGLVKEGDIIEYASDIPKD